MFSKDIVNKICPVDKYVGGAEHACMHLLYARFFTKAMRDMGLLDFDEPFTSLVHQGTILGSDGQKMSKSKGNTVAPDDYISKYGSDVFRTYLGFGFAYIEGGPWSDKGLQAILKFIRRVENLAAEAASASSDISSVNMGAAEKELNYALNYTIKSATTDIDRFQFNTSIARMMELLNAITKYSQTEGYSKEFYRYVVEKLILILSPFAPHFCEETWCETLGNSYSVFDQKWPEFDESALVKDSVEIAVQLNGKIIFREEIPSEADQAQVEELIKNDERFISALAGRNIVKFIYVKGRIANIVVK